MLDNKINEKETDNKADVGMFNVQHLLNRIKTNPPSVVNDQMIAYAYIRKIKEGGDNKYERTE